MQDTLVFASKQKNEVIDISNEVAAVVGNAGIRTGICHVYTHHTSAAIIINENADPNIFEDIFQSLSEFIPAGKWRHDQVDGNADSHIKATLLGPSESIPIKDGKLVLGTWQGIHFCELDGPRSNRKTTITIVGE